MRAALVIVLLFLSHATTLSASQQAEAAGPRGLRLAIAGLVHGHAQGFLRAAQERDDVDIVGIFEPEPAWRERYKQRFGFVDAVFFSDLESMLDRAKPEAVAVFTNTYDHPMVVEACAARRLPVMMEKPLAVSVEHARRIQLAAERGGIPVVVNYETTWYPSHAALWSLMKERRAAGRIRRIVAMDGHRGPKEIGVGPEFLGWLADPVKNGAGALFDFGCYGANLMTWLMDGERPSSVTALTQRLKPEVYPNVDDDATILLEYPSALGIIQASWNWPFNRKDLEVYGENGFAIAQGGKTLRMRLADGEEHASIPPPLRPDERDSISYLKAVVRGKLKPSGLSSLENNLIVTEILEAARESARARKTITLQGH